MTLLDQSPALAPAAPTTTLERSRFGVTARLQPDSKAAALELDFRAGAKRM
jgi:hypothetical protein